jgi:hypothetical protein
MTNFLKLNQESDFFKGVVPLKPVYYTVVIVFINGFRKDVYGIENPFQFINALKKNPKISYAFIRDEK